MEAPETVDEVIGMSKQAKKTGGVVSMTQRYSIGHKAISVALSVVLLGFGWPTTSLAKANEAEGSTAVATDQAAKQTATDGASGAASAQSSTIPDEAEVSLNLGSAYITYSNQDITLPAKKVTVPTNKDFKFTATADEGYELTAVYLTIDDGEKSEIDPDASGVFTVAAADVIAGASIELETEERAGDVTAGELTVISEDTVIPASSLENDAANKEVQVGDTITLTANAKASSDRWSAWSFSDQGKVTDVSSNSNEVTFKASTVGEISVTYNYQDAAYAKHTEQFVVDIVDRADAKTSGITGNTDVTTDESITLTETKGADYWEWNFVGDGDWDAAEITNRNNEKCTIKGLYHFKGESKTLKLQCIYKVPGTNTKYTDVYEVTVHKRSWKITDWTYVEGTHFCTPTIVDSVTGESINEWEGGYRKEYFINGTSVGNAPWTGAFKDDSNSYEVKIYPFGDDGWNSKYAANSDAGNVDVYVDPVPAGNKNAEINSDDPANVEYDGAEHKWVPTVTDESGAAVSENGYIVTYKRDGAETSDFTSPGTITVTIAGKDGYSGTIERSYSITDLKVTGNDTLGAGKLAPYTASGFSGDVTWSTSDPSIATVDANGVVTAVAKGHVDIIATYGTEVAKKNIEVTEPSSANGWYNATFTSTIENADVVYFNWHNSSDASNVAFTPATSSFTVNDYTTTTESGYAVFFVKPNDNYIITGLGASGAGQMYAVDAASWGAINGYPGISTVMEAAKAAGYVAAFGYSRGPKSSMTQSFEVTAKSPDMSIAATSSRTKDVAAGDELTFTVTITPQTTGSGKDYVTGVKVNSAEVNGTEVTVENLTKNSDGTYTGYVHYTATDNDCNRGSVVLTVEATTTYEGSFTITSGGITTGAEVTKSATCACQIAPESQVKYQFVSGTSGMALPSAINDFLPWDKESYAAGKTVKAKDPSQKEYDDSKNDGYWSFSGWDKESATVGRNGETVSFTGTWVFTHYSDYTIKFVDEKGNEIANPKVVGGNKIGDEIKKDAVEHPEIQGYAYSKTSPDTLTINDDDSKNIITVTYKQKTGKAGYNLVLNNASWTAPDKTTNTEKMKWYFDYGFAKGDTFVVTGNEPTAKDHVFIGWMDKERDGQAAAVRKAGDTVTYCYSKNQTYTLDALWASLSATGEDVTYDGESHTVTVDVKINDGTGLDAKYVEQAKQLITTGNVQYSTDGGKTWSTEKPSYKDAGTYTVQIKQDVTVGGATTTLAAETQVKIAQKEYFVKTNTESKTYDGSELVGIATVEGLVDGESAKATATTVGPNVTASTTNAVTGEVVWAEGTKSDNYKRAEDQLGTLEITKKDASAYEASVSISGWTYDGTFDPNETLTSSNGAGNGQATYTYYKKNGENWDGLSAAPVDAGSYKVVANWAETTNYPALSAECEFTIAKAVITVTGSFATDYTGQEQTKYIYAENGTKVDGVTVTGVASGEVLKLWNCPISGTNAGTYARGNDALNGYQWNVKKGGEAASDSTGNYTISVSGTLTIREKDGLSLTAEGYSDMYDGQSHSGTVTVNVAEGTVIEYSTDGGNTWSTDEPTITNVVRGADGAASATSVKVRAYNANYKNSSAEKALEASYSLEVKPRVITASAEDTREYNGQDQSLSITADNAAALDESKKTGVVNGETLALNNAAITGNAAHEYTTVSDGYTWDVTKADGSSTKGNYSIAVSGKLTITPISFAVTAPSDVVYNGGQQHQTPVVKGIGGNVLTEGTDYSLSYSEDATNAGTVTVTVAGIGNYAGTIEMSYKITPRAVTLTSGSATKAYDGTELTNGEVTATAFSSDAGTGFVDGEGFTAATTGKITNAGSVKNEFTYALNDGTKAGNYTITKVEGTLEVTKLAAANLNLKGTNVSVVYDSDSHAAGTATVSPKDNNGNALSDNVKIEYQLASDPSSDWYMDPSAIKQLHATTEPVVVNVRATSANFEGVATTTETITVTKRPVQLYTKSASKVYDGTALTTKSDWDGYEVRPYQNGGFVYSDYVKGTDGWPIIECTGSQTDVGSSDNTIKCEIKPDRLGDYDISEPVLGTLTVLAQSLDPQTDPADPEKRYTGAKVNNPSDTTYDGQTHQWEPTVKNGKGKTLTEGTDYTVTYKRGDDATGDFASAGTITVTITGKGNYAGSVTKTYTITPAPLKVSTPDATKIYDGTALTAAATSANISGLVAGETATVKATGTITEVGTKTNTYDGIEWGSAKESNYYVQSQNEGTLKVLAQSIDPSTDPADPDKRYDGATVNNPSDTTYDGQTHQWEPTVKNGKGKTLTEGTDYTVTYKRGDDATDDFASAGTISVTITGKGNYAGSVTKTYVIDKAQVSVVTASDSKVYDGTALTKADGATITGLVNNETAGIAGTGTITEVGAETNTYAITWAGEGNTYTAKESNYKVSGAELGTLTVTESTDEIVVTTTGGEFTYDAQPHGATVTVGTLPTGYSVKTASSNATATDVTEGVTATADNLVIVNASGNDVTSELNIKKADGTIKVNPAPLTVTTYGDTKTYDGTALTAGGKIEGLVNQEAAELVTKGSITEVGNTQNTYTINWNDNAKQTNYEVVTENLGTLKVNPITVSLYVVPVGATKVYDGESLTGSTANVFGSLPTGYTYEYTLKGAQTDVGWSYVEVDTFKILNKDDKDVTSQFTGYNTEFKNTLTVTKRPVTVTSANGTKTYDGSALVAYSATASETGENKGMVSGESFDFDYTGTQTDADSSPNWFVAKDSSTAKVSNYDITYAWGTLEVTPATLTVVTSGGEKAYDGEALTAGGEISGFVNGESATFKTTGSQKYVGESENTYSIDWNNATANKDNYTVVPTLGTLKVSDEDVDNGKVINKSHEDGTYALGSTVSFTIKATNIYAEAKTLTISEIEGVTLDRSVFESVEPGETVTATATYAIQENDILAGTFVNTAKVAFSDVEKTFSNTDEVDVDEANPQLVITKTSDVAADHLLKEGETVNYAVTVANTGNLTLSNVAVDDQLEGATLAEGESTAIDSLAPGTSTTLHYSYTVKQSDVVAGKVANHATATADNDSDKDTDVVPGDTVDPTEKAEPSLFVGKTADKTANVAAGDVITYTITATNNGNVDLAGVVVSDELVGFTSEAFDLAKGESKVFTQTYTVTEADMLAGSVKNVATASANDPSGNVVPGSGETTTETDDVSGALSVVKTAAAGTYAAGDTIEYTIAVTNTGNVTVSDIKVADAKTGLDETVTLAKGESKTFTTSYVVTDEDIAAGTLTNVATARGTDPAGKDVEATGTETIGNDPQTDPDNPDGPTLKREFKVAAPSDVVYNGAEQYQKPLVTDGDKVLVEGVDYELSYSNDVTNVGTVTVTVTGEGNYTGMHEVTYQITPATLIITTGSATKAYDGTELTEGTLTISGLKGSDKVRGATTGTQTEVGSSTNTYRITWGDTKASNYTIVEELGMLTVTAAAVPTPTPTPTTPETPTNPDNPTPTPETPENPTTPTVPTDQTPTTTPTTPTNPSTPSSSTTPTTTGTTPTATPATPVDTIANVLENVYETVTGDTEAASEEQIYDEENPLGTFSEEPQHCWVHFYTIIGLVLTVLYGAAVALRRGKHTRKLRNDMNNVLGGGDDGKDPSGSPVASTQPSSIGA